jgi:F1F0 ATPase subunit 2
MGILCDSRIGRLVGRGSYVSRGGARGMDRPSLAKPLFLDAPVADERAGAGLHKRMAADQGGPTVSAVSIASRLLAGAALGIFFYTGLYFTIRVLLTTRHPIPLLLGSLGCRTLIVVASILFLTEAHWQYALTCLAGFLLGRVAVSKSLRVQAARTKCP